MIYLDLPHGSAHGWGICGDALTREFYKIRDVHSINDMDLSQGVSEVPGALLQCVQSKHFEPLHDVRGNPTVGYAFFEDTVLEPEWLELARRYDRLAVGSTWMRGLLQGYEVPSEVVLQGVDTKPFRPGPRTYFKNKFVVFSGGKFELRKGQDLVIRAMRVLMDQRPDVMLLAQWTNYWPASRDTMAQSPHIEYQPGDDIRKTLVNEGIDLSRVVLLGPCPQHAMAMIYQQADCAVFPNRCEGGTNLVLMECMASGLPCVVSYNSGHRDVVTPETAKLLRLYEFMQVRNGTGKVSAQWHDPNLEELIESLEWAYTNREQCLELGRAARKLMDKFTWESAAWQFVDLLGFPA